jgi:hypothetical protein
MAKILKKRIKKDGEWQYEMLMKDGGRTWTGEDDIPLKLIQDFEWKRLHNEENRRKRNATLPPSTGSRRSTRLAGHELRCLSFDAQPAPPTNPKLKTCPWMCMLYAILITTLLLIRGTHGSPHLSNHQPLSSARVNTSLTSNDTTMDQTVPLRPLTSEGRAAEALDAIEEGSGDDPHKPSAHKQQFFPRSTNQSEGIIRTIYNCSAISPVSLRPLHRSVNCSLPHSNTDEKMSVFTAKYRKLVRHVTRVTLHKCRMYLLELVCSESWRG